MNGSGTVGEDYNVTGEGENQSITSIKAIHVKAVSYTHLGQYENEYWNGEYKTIEDGLLKADLLGFNANKRKVTSSSPWKPETGQLACGKSFIVYENMVDAVKPGQRTLLVLKGTYTAVSYTHLISFVIM